MSSANLSTTSRSSKGQFTAIILADVDTHALYPLSSDMIKSLLPLANRPLLQYQLDLLSSSGFTEAVVVTTRDAHARVEIFIQNEYRGDVAVDLVAVENHFGTAEMLRAVKDRIKTDFLVVTGDLVLGKHLRDAIDLHRSKRSDVTFLLKRLGSPEIEEGGGQGGGGGKGAGEKGGAKKKKGAAATAAAPDDEDEDMDYFGLVSGEQRVVWKVPAITLEGTTLRASKALLRRVSQFTIHSNLVDSNLYLLAHWVLELLENKEDFTSLEEDVVPYIVRQQFRGPEACGLSRSIGNTENENMIASLSASSVYGRPDDGPRCYAHILEASKSYCAKLISLQSYMAINRELMASVPRELATWPPLEGLRPKEGCVVGEGCVLGGQVNMRTSVLGAGCKVGTRVKIHSCVIMDNVTIQDGVTLQNTVVCPYAVIQEMCSLTDSFVGPHVLVPPKTKCKNDEFLRD